MPVDQITLSKLLVANRGEIALRVMRTAKKMGIRTVAVYSDADKNMPFVKFADESVHIGPSPVSESYLNIDAVINAATQTDSDAIHPGYGFLSENVQFSQACRKAGLNFIGPPDKAIDIMGDKARSKRAMIERNVPCIPGYQGDDQNDDLLIAKSIEIGLPVMIKAAAGGGGRGMRLVFDEKELANAISLARSEAKNAFGSDHLIVEKAILNPRHVEIQVFADRHGNFVHLAERDCSVQRRHQKIIEEAPCPVMTPTLRETMGMAAIQAAKAVDYVGAGTVEFLLDKEGQFYFLEMNTRLQVEHPVTEMILGLDLVEWQIKVARGESLPLDQKDIAINGHAIEVRLYAEDPANDFLPSTGAIRLYQKPSSDLARTDDGIDGNSELSPFYDSMIAKIITHAPSRDEAHTKMVQALEKTGVLGVKTNRDFLLKALDKTEFRRGKATTSFIDRNFEDLDFDHENPTIEEIALTALTQHHCAYLDARAQALDVSDELLNWSSTGNLRSLYLYKINDDLCPVEISANGKDRYDVQIDDKVMQAGLISFTNNAAEFYLNDKKYRHYFTISARHSIELVTDRKTLSMTNIAFGQPTAEDSVAGGQILSPMHGVLLDLTVKTRQKVQKGQKLAVLEAMKMQHEITAPSDGEVHEISAQQGDQIAADAVIMILDVDG